MDLTTIGSWILAILGISFLIFIHEAGHFLAARLFGVRVETFSIGFGPRIFGTRRGDTDYRISAIPLGGYVKMAGEYGDFAEDVPLQPDDLNAKPIWQRAIIFSGGVLVNFAFAFAAFPLVFALKPPFVAPVLGHVEAGGGAWTAGLQPGDEIVRMDGRRAYEFSDIALYTALGDPEGIEAHVLRQGDGGEQEFDVLLMPSRNELEGRFEIGVAPAQSNQIVVDADSPAWTAGLRTDDRLVSVQGVAMRGHLDMLTRFSEAAGTDTTIELVVEREGREITALIEPLITSPDPDDRRIGVLPATTRVVAFRAVDGDDAFPGRDDATFPLRKGDAVLSVGGRTVATGRALREVLAEHAAGDVPAEVRRGAHVREVVIDTESRQAIRDGHVAFGADLSPCRIQVTPDGAVAAAGLRNGDEIRALDGQTILDYQELVTTLNASKSPRHSIRYWRHTDDAEANLVVEGKPFELRNFGISILAQQVVYDFGLSESMTAGFETSINGLRNTWLTVTKLISGDVGTQNLGGIVMIMDTSVRFADTGIAKLLFFLALLSINLGIINILPIPVLDGGQILFLVFEKVKGSRLSDRFLNGAQIAGLVAILTLVVYVTYNDIMRLFV